jgi:hypothetical protein
VLANNSKTDAAAAQFRKIERDRDGKKATAEYEAAAKATRANTERLKALRLARDAELAATVVPPATRAKRKG